MKKKKTDESEKLKDSFEKKTRKQQKQKYTLKLYITGSTPNSMKSIKNLKNICDEHLEGRYDLEIIDIYQQPALSKGEQIVAAPTLIKKLPLPMRKLIGDLSDTERVLFGLDLGKSDDYEEAPK